MQKTVLMKNIGNILEEMVMIKVNVYTIMVLSLISNSDEGLEQLQIIRRNGHMFCISYKIHFGTKFNTILLIAVYVFLKD